MIAEYWADGPRSELPPGHWNLFAQFVVAPRPPRDHEHGLERDVKLFFALTNAVSDAGCCAWDNKRAFDSVRPITAIRTLFARPGRSAPGPAPYQGTKLIDGAAWFPYQPTTFPTPPFPEYSSGHSNFSAAGAEILKLFTGSDRFGGSVTLPAGSSRVEPGRGPVERPHALLGDVLGRGQRRPASPAATAASTSSKATSTRAPPAGWLPARVGEGSGLLGRRLIPSDCMAHRVGSRFVTAGRKGESMKRVCGALAVLVAACALVPVASAAGPAVVNGGGRGTAEGRAFSQFGFNVTRSADGSVQGHFNCLMAGSSQFPGFT